MKRVFRPAVQHLEDRIALATAGHAATKAVASTTPVAPAAVMIPLSVATAEVNHLYQDTLGRDPDGLAVAGFIPAIQAGTTPAQLTTTLVSSAEYIDAHISATAAGAANQASYVTALYNTVLGRAPDPAGLAAFTNAINTNAMSLAQVAAAIVNSPEAATSKASILVRDAFPALATTALTGLYQDALGRTPDPQALATIVPAMSAGTTMPQLTAELVSSPEFIDAHISATAAGAANQASYVTALYNTVLGRAPDPAGLAAFTDAINTNAMSLAQVAAAIVDSPEAATSTTSILKMVVL